MKPDPRIAKLARLLVEYSVDVKKNDNVCIHGTTVSEPLLREIYREVIRAGAHPRVHIQFQDQEYLFYSLAEDHQLAYTNPFDLYEMEHADALINVLPNFNPYALTSVNPKKKQKTTMAQKPLFEAVFKRWNEGKLRWVGTAFPSTALAQEARMSLDEYADFLFSCMHLDDDDPVAYWRQFSDWQERLCRRLNKAKEMRYVGQDTDLRFRCEGRTWLNADGKNNFPDGEVCTSPIEDSVEGTIRFTFPGIYQGEEIEDIFLRFEKGRVVETRAAKGETLLNTLLETDEGARYVGEIAVGTNENIDRFTKNMLLDEKMGGTVHVAVGMGIPQCGTKNMSAVHWDMLKDMRDGGEIYADGKLIYRNGSFIE